MSFLSVTDDELALMRFTCDLFFCEESPLYYLEEQQREPQDYGAAYNALVERGLIDPRGFRLTDETLNRIAPVTECDARVVHVVQRDDGGVAQVDHYLLDEIAVSYERIGDRHLFGTDLDHDELVESLARLFVPRRAGGDRLEVVVTSLEFLALTQLLELVRQSGDREQPLAAVKALFQRPPPEDLRPPTAALFPRRPARARSGAVVDDPQWDDAVRSLLEKGAVRMHKASLWVHSSLVDLAVRPLGERHSFVRTDFGEDDWFVRETTFIPVEGSLFFLGPKKGGIAIEELDGERMRRALMEAVGPLSKDRAVPSPQRLSDLLVKSEPVKA
jgi:hypothetical protein